MILVDLSVLARLLLIEPDQVKPRKHNLEKSGSETMRLVTTFIKRRTLDEVRTLASAAPCKEPTAYAALAIA